MNEKTPTITKRIEHMYDGQCINVERIILESSDPAVAPVVRDVVRHPGAVVILPVLDDGRYVLIRNRRQAVDQTMWELCAGTLEPPEPPDQCAARELIEETGYEAQHIELLGRFYTTPGFCDEFMYAYVATGLKHIGQRLEPGEHIETFIRSPDEVREMVRNGDLVDAKSMLTILLYERGSAWSPADP